MAITDRGIDGANFFLELLNLGLAMKARSGLRTFSSTGGSSSPRRQIIAEMIERVVNELGWGVRDEGLFPIKIGRLPAPERLIIEKLIAEHDDKLIERLRLITVNIPSPVAKVVKSKGKKEKRNKDGDVIEEATPDTEEAVTSDKDNGVEFLKSIACMVNGKSKEDQVSILEKLNVAQGEAGVLYKESLKNMAKKVAKVVGLNEDAPLADLVHKLEAYSRELAEPAKPVKMSLVGRFVNACLIGPKDEPEPFKLPKFLQRKDR